MARAIDAEELKETITDGLAALSEHMGQYELVFTAITHTVQNTIDKAPTIEPKQEWISVRDRLPEEGQEVLCFCAGGLANVYTWTCEEWEDSYGYYEDDDIISHWMPLPEPPERGESKC